MVKFTANKEDLTLISKINKKAIRLRLPVPAGTMFAMDMDATHSNGGGLDFGKLLEFDDFN